MARGILFAPDAWEDVNYWTREDLPTLRKTIELLQDCRRDPFKGLGKPEPLKHSRFRGIWSRRIDDKHRLIYSVTDDNILVARCRGHYDDK